MRQALGDRRASAPGSGRLGRMKRIDDTEAFALYVAMGPTRSYRAVGETLGFATRSIEQHAADRTWQARLAEIEAQAARRSEDELVDVVAEMNRRQAEAGQRLQAQALAALEGRATFETARDAIRGLEVGARLERTARGEPAEHHELSVADVVRQQHARWLGPGSDEDDDGGEEDGRCEDRRIDERPGTGGF